MHIKKKINEGKPKQHIELEMLREKERSRLKGKDREDFDEMKARQKFYLKKHFGQTPKDFDREMHDIKD